MENLERQFQALAAAEYTGWVAWLSTGGAEWTSVYEARPHNPKLAQVMYELRGTPEERVRQVDNRTKDWNHLLPADIHRRIQLVAVFGHYGLYTEQPLIVIQREALHTEMRFIQFKARGLQLPGHAGGQGIVRTGIYSYTLGYWNPVMQFSELIEATPTGRQRRSAKHPCWPRPHGFGLAPFVAGLTEADVPPVPDSADEWVA